MAKTDRDEPPSKRPPMGRLDSESRVKQHVVGGGTGRLHARVPSSKALHKHHTAHTDNAHHNTHRRAVSDVKLARDPSATDLKNTTTSALKRNKSNVDVQKKTKGATSQKRSYSNAAVDKYQSKVHFNLGDDDVDGADSQDGEWVDASASASPHLSRRGSTVNSGNEPSSANPPASAATSRPQSPNQTDRMTDNPPAKKTTTPNPAPGTTSSSDLQTAHHKQYLTSRLLRRSSSYVAAAPQMSTETVSARPVSSRPLSKTARASMDQLHSAASSSGQETLAHTATSTSTGPGSSQGASFTMAVNSEVANRTAKELAGNMAKGPDGHATDDEDVMNYGLAAGGIQRRIQPVPSTRDMSRTQQKLDLQRAACSTAETPHKGLNVDLGALDITIPDSAIPLKTISTYDPLEPKEHKLLEKSGLDYLVVRRFQNPVARSIHRLQQLSLADKSRRIPRPSTSHSKKGPDLQVAAMLGSQASRRPETPRRSTSLRTVSTAGADADDNMTRIDSPTQRAMSGSSLVGRDGDEDAGTIAALLRNIWDKSLDLSNSQ